MPTNRPSSLTEKPKTDREEERKTCSRDDKQLTEKLFFHDSNRVQNFDAGNLLHPIHMDLEPDPWIEPRCGILRYQTVELSKGPLTCQSSTMLTTNDSSLRSKIFLLQALQNDQSK